MIPIICIVGASDSGKTTVLENLIPVLNDRGYRVGTLKHDVHGFEMDRQGKDTWRHRRAGAATIAISSSSQVACIRTVEQELSLDQIVSRYFWAEDLVLVEGYKRYPRPKIEVFRRAVLDHPLCTEKDNLLAVISDDPVDLDVPRFGFEQIAAVADLIEERFLKSRKAHPLEVFLDGKKLPMNHFVQEIMIGAVMGILKRLRGWNDPREVLIRMKVGDDS